MYNVRLNPLDYPRHMLDAHTKMHLKLNKPTFLHDFNSVFFELELGGWLALLEHPAGGVLDFCAGGAGCTSSGNGSGGSSSGNGNGHAKMDFAAQRRSIRQDSFNAL